MNYLAHGYRFLDRPLFVAGTAVPDWLSVVNRRVRARSRRVQPIVEQTTDENVRLLGQGILQHHHDDDLFHRTPAFMQLEGELSREFRRHLPDRYDHRPPFLGHIVVELMLDASLADRTPRLLDDFYETMAAVDEQEVENIVNTMTARPIDDLAWFIERFRQERFLDDYMTDEGLFKRLNQVLRRVRLDVMPDDCIAVLAGARRVVYERHAELLAAFSSHC